MLTAHGRRTLRLIRRLVNVPAALPARDLRGDQRGEVRT